ncbi:MAG: NUDIX domain-containing protein [Candidatus Paceibacterota bacterium]|jgi:8-oxo-dGTP pyrophosphatase MutT (NUDIX family)
MTEIYMPEVRAGAILVKKDEVLLMFRKNFKEYYVFPGGGVEENEDIKQAVLRELQEESSIEAKINKLLYRHIYDDGKEQYFYLCDYVSGVPELKKDTTEYQKMLRGEDFYEPRWCKIEELNNMLVFPLEVRDLLIEDFKNNFSNPVKIFNLKISELRKNI